MATEVSWYDGSNRWKL